MNFLKLLPLIVLTISLMTCGEHDQSQSTDEQTISQYQTCIDRIMTTDDSLGAIRNRASERISLSETIQQYTDALGSLDFSDCPESFASGFEIHRQAWINMLVITNDYPDMRGEMHELFSLLEHGQDSARFHPLLKEIWDSWGDIEKAIEKSKNDHL